MKKNFYFNSILIISCVFITLFSQCGDSKKKQRPDTKSSNRSELKKVEYSFDNPPKFRKDDELHFVDQNTGQVLFSIDIEVVSTDEDKARGLMFRPEMDEKNGMLFIMGREERQSFYMRNTIISLDIIYVNAKFEIVDIYKNTRIKDETSLPSAAPAKYVVEINAGLCDKYGIKIGDTIYF